MGEKFNKGGKKGGGRKKGTPNKFTKDLKAAYLEVFEERGGAKGLLAWSQDNPDAYYSQVAKMLPKEIEAKVEGEMYFPDLILHG